MGAGPAADCREDFENNPLCAAFTLQLTPTYQPVCDYACAMWAPSATVGAKGRFLRTLPCFLVTLTCYYYHHHQQQWRASAERLWTPRSVAVPVWHSSGAGTTSTAWSSTIWVSPLLDATCTVGVHCTQPVLTISLFYLFACCLVDDTCTSSAQLQCFNPFQAQTTTAQGGSSTAQADPSRGSADCTQDSSGPLSQAWVVATLTGGVAVLCLLLGALLGSYYRTQRALQQQTEPMSLAGAQKQGLLSGGTSVVALEYAGGLDQQALLLGEM